MLPRCEMFIPSWSQAQENDEGWVQWQRQWNVENDIRWGLIGDKQHRIEMDGGDQLGRYLSFLDNGVKEEEKENEKEEKEKEEEKDSYAGRSI